MDSDHGDWQKAAKRMRGQAVMLLPDSATVATIIRREYSGSRHSDGQPSSKGRNNLRKIPRTEKAGPHA